MVRHVVLWTFKDDVPRAEREALLGAARELVGTVPTIRSLEVGENISPARAEGYSHVLVVTFDDRAGLAAYLSHPAHVVTGARLGRAVSQLLAVDLES